MLDEAHLKTVRHSVSEREKLPKAKVVLCSSCSILHHLLPAQTLPKDNKKGKHESRVSLLYRVCVSVVVTAAKLSNLHILLHGDGNSRSKLWISFSEAEVW